MMTETRRLIAEYAATRSEQAFCDLTARYIHLVYGTAVRLMNGDTHRAEDVVQTVFMDLARLARTLSPEVMLGGWLHRRTCHVAANIIRSERRRQKRERQAAEMKALEESDPNLNHILQVLDEAMNHLKASDRAAIFLRFFEGRDLLALGAALGTSEDAAQKRVARALEKLRVLLTRRGITASCAVLASVLTAHSANLAPPGLAATVSTAALAGASGKTGVTLTFLKLTAMAKMKVASGAALALSLGTIVIIEHQTWSALGQQHQALQQQWLILNSQKRGSEVGLPTSALSSPALNPAELAELERLRKEVMAYRQQANPLANLEAENRKLRVAYAGDQTKNPAEAEFQHENHRRVQDLKKWGLMFRVYANDHNGQFPDTWEQVATQIPETERASFLKFARENYEIVYHGNETGISNRWEGILFREKQPRLSPSGKLFKVYGHFDGSASTRSQPGVNFDDFEKQNIVPNERK